MGWESRTVYRTLGELVLEAAVTFRPPERVTVAEAAQKYVYLNNAPTYIGPYKNDETPYMREPMDMTQSRDHTAVIFCGPAQSGKTQSVILNTLAYLITCNPMDAIVYHMTQAASRDFSKRRIDRMHRHSPLVGGQVIKGQHADNTHDKSYKSGMLLTISWPSISEMSSKPVPVVMFTDYDRMNDDVDGEGSPFVLGQKRTTTFRNLGMTIVDSSPGRDVEDPKWKQQTPHEAPPVGGVLGLYNQGDRRRWYWPCLQCGEFYEPSFKMLTWVAYREVDGEKIELEVDEIGESAKMACPHCGGLMENSDRHDVNSCGVWLREGEKIRPDGTRYGTPRRSKTASYWLKGPAATYQSWKSMVVNYLNAEASYAANGSIEELKATINTDQAEPYMPRGMENERLADDIAAGAIKLPEKMVPDDVRCLFATVDVQKNRWEVQVHGVRPGINDDDEYIDGSYDIVVIDRFKIEKSNRRDDDGERLWVKPAAYPEDWDLLITEVMDKRYALADGNGSMSIALTLCDSGGKAGVTTNAYNFYRKLKTLSRGDRFVLVKGDPSPKSPRAHLELPDSQRKDRNAQARGEVPVLFFNSNSLKDTVNGMLGRTESGGGKIDFPSWLPQSYYEELTVEVRTPKGWIVPLKRPNEAWDLLYYCVGACVFRKIEKVNWSEPPPWLAPQETNSLVVWTAAPEAGVDKPSSMADRLSTLAGELA